MAEFCFISLGEIHIAAYHSDPRRHVEAFQRQSAADSQFNRPRPPLCQSAVFIYQSERKCAESEKSLKSKILI